MEQASIDLLAERIVRLERENRRLKRIGAAVVLGLFGVMIAGVAIPPCPISSRRGSSAWSMSRAVGGSPPL